MYHRWHGGREYVRLRVWHRHRDLGRWYPDRYRKFIVPLDDAVPLGQAIVRAAQSHVAEMPDWLADIERQEVIAELTPVKKDFHFQVNVPCPGHQMKRVRFTEKRTRLLQAHEL